MTNELLKAKALSAYHLFGKKKETIYKPTRAERIYMAVLNNLKKNK